MRLFMAFLVCSSSAIWIGIAVLAVHAGALPFDAGEAIIGALAILTAFMVYVALHGPGRCHLCGRPIEDDRAAGDWAVKYGVRACRVCGPRLDARFGQDGLPPEPPWVPPIP